MKKFLIALNIVIWSFVGYQVTAYADAPAKAEKVCITTKDAKTGKDVEKCKVMKKHEKKEGTKVEGTKPDVQPKKK